MVQITKGSLRESVRILATIMPALDEELEAYIHLPQKTVRLAQYQNTFNWINFILK